MPLGHTINTAQVHVHYAGSVAPGLMNVVISIAMELFTYPAFSLDLSIYCYVCRFICALSSSYCISM